MGAVKTGKPRTPAEKWPRQPNLRRRPPAPAKGNGRVQRQIRRAFTALGVEVLSATEIYDWTHPRRRMERRAMRAGVYSRTRRTLRTMCEPVERVPPYGGWTWRLKDSQK
jgi:hypothetical protein